MRTAVRQAGVPATLRVSPLLEKLTNEKYTESATAKHHATANIVRSRPRAWVRLHHGSGRRGAEPYSARHSDWYYTTGGQFPFLVGHALGTQGYVCLPTAVGASTASWTVKAARPEATLFQNIFAQTFQIITHFLSPDTNPNDAAPNPLPFGSATWQSSLDSSKVWAAVLDPKRNAIPAGSDASCPNTGSIACLLLTSIGSEQGPSGGKTLSKTTFIQRLNTAGGSAPTDGCSTSADVGNQVLVPYTADYFFYKQQ